MEWNQCKYIPLLHCFFNSYIQLSTSTVFPEISWDSKQGHNIVALMKPPYLAHKSTYSSLLPSTFNLFLYFLFYPITLLLNQLFITPQRILHHYPINKLFTFHITLSLLPLYYMNNILPCLVL